MREFKTIYINNVGEKIEESLYERVTDICAPRPMTEHQKQMARRRLQAMKKRKLFHAGEYNTDSFLEGIRYAMELKGVSIKTLSKKTGFSHSQTIKHIQGYAGMHYYQMEAFCKALGIKISFRNTFNNQNKQS